MRRDFFEDLVAFYENQILDWLKLGRGDKVEEVREDLAYLQEHWQKMEKAR